MRIVIRKRKHWTREEKDNACASFICLYFLLDNVNSIVQDVFGFSGNRLSLTKLLIGGVLFFMLARAVLHFSKREWQLFIIAELFGFLLYLYSYFVGVPLNTLLPWAGTMLGVNIPLFYCALTIRDKGILYKKIIAYSYLLFALLVIQMQGNITGKQYDLHFSYALLLVIILHFNEVFNGQSKLHLFVSITGLIMIVLFGSRGALICLLVYFILKVFAGIENKTRRFFYIVLLLVSFAGIAWISNNELAIRNYFAINGYTSRSLRLFVQGSFISHDSGRFKLWNAVIEAIKGRVWLGWGVRGALSRMQGHPYPHQFFLDLWLSFGVPLGSAIVILLLIPLRRIALERNGIDKDLMQIFGCVGFISLMYSNTVFLCQYYYVFLGFILSKKTRMKEDLNNAFRENCQSLV